MTEGNENSEKIIIGKIHTCLNSSCEGWLVDSFSGKYWIECIDPKHDVCVKAKEKVEGREANPNPHQPLEQVQSPPGGTRDD